MHEANDSCMESYPETFRCKENSVDDVSANLRHSAYISQPEPSDKDDSTTSSQLSVTSDTNASFSQPIEEDSVHSSTTLTNQHQSLGAISLLE